MGRVAVVALLLLLAFATAATAADETSWRVNFRADNGEGMHYGGACQLGVYPTASDELDPEDKSPYSFDLIRPYTTTLVLTQIPGQNAAYSRNIQSPHKPPVTWDFYVAGNVDYAQPQIRLQAFTTTVLPTPTWQGTPVKYYVKMLDNKGVAGAPANGTIWDLPIPTVYNSTVAFWTSPVNLPTVKISAGTPAAMFSEAYKFQFVQEIVPEPSSLLALGSGLLALGGLIRRRRV